MRTWATAAAFIVVLAAMAAGFAVPQWLSAPPKTEDTRPAGLPTLPTEPADRPGTAQPGPGNAVALPITAMPGAATGNVSSLSAPISNDGIVSRTSKPSTESAMARVDTASAPAQRPAEQVPVPEPVQPDKEPALMAPLPTVARAPSADRNASPVSQMEDSPPQETPTPSNGEPPAPAPVQQTPLPRPPNTTQSAAHVPGWLTAHVGDQDRQIARVVLQRARALYQDKVSDGQVKNSCYFAMDATRPNVLSDGQAGHRFYIICERDRIFRAISAGHGSGRKLKGLADFSNGRSCVKNFGNALDSRLTAGGAYLTSETKTSFKGYYQLSAKKSAPFSRTFIQYDGEGGTANARERQIGGHAAEVLKSVCRRKDPGSPYADRDGYVPFGKLVDYSSGRSDGCTSWSAADAKQIISIVKGNPTTLYIYPEEADVDAVDAALAKGQSLSHESLYWNKACLKEISSPKFWPKTTLGPILAQYKKQHPVSPGGPLPICKK